MKAYLGNDGFVYTRKSKNRAYIGEVVGEATEDGRFAINLNPQLSCRACNALSNAKIESHAIEEE